MENENRPTRAGGRTGPTRAGRGGEGSYDDSSSVLRVAVLDQPLQFLADDRLGELGDDLPGDLLDDLAGGFRQGIAQQRLAPIGGGSGPGRHGGGRRGRNRRWS